MLPLGLTPVTHVGGSISCQPVCVCVKMDTSRTSVGKEKKNEGRHLQNVRGLKSL